LLAAVPIDKLIDFNAQARQFERGSHQAHAVETRKGTKYTIK
jgi:hypothetical protein